MRPSSKPLARATLANVVVVAGAWLAALVLVQVARAAVDVWFVSPIAILLAGGGGAVAAFRLKAPFALFLILGAEAWVASTLVSHAIWGIRSVQGGPTHLAIGAAAMLGVALGAVGAMAMWSAGGQRRRRSTAEV